MFEQRQSNQVFPGQSRLPLGGRIGFLGQAYADALIEQDVADIANLDRRRDMPRLVELLAQHCSEMVNLTQLGAQLGMDRKTVDRHLCVLEQMFLVRRVRPWFRNELKRLAKAPKLHFFDAGLAAAMRKLNPEALGPDRVSLGPIVETFAFSELSANRRPGVMSGSAFTTIVTMTVQRSISFLRTGDARLSPLR